MGERVGSEGGKMRGSKELTLSEECWGHQLGHLMNALARRALRALRPGPPISSPPPRSRAPPNVVPNHPVLGPRLEREDTREKPNQTCLENNKSS